MRRAADLFGSRQLALLLFFATAVLALYGSFVPPEKAELVFFKGYGERSLPAARFLGLIDTYHSPVFLTLLGSLAVNLIVCTSSRLVRHHRRAHGPRSDRRAGMTALLDLLVHLSVLLVLAGGGAKGIWGTTVTKNVYVGLSTETALDWRLDAEIPLGFTVLVKERVEEYYPPRARVGVKRSDTGAKIALLEVEAGSPATVTGGALALKFAAFERQGGRFFFSAVIAGEEADFMLEGKKGANVVAVGPYTFTLASFRDDLRSVRSLIQVVEGAAVAVEGWLGPNERIAHRGTNIFQTAWGADEFGNRFVGLQFVRDPGAPLFWAGCALLAVLMPAYLFQRHGWRIASPGAGADGHSRGSN